MSGQRSGGGQVSLSWQKVVRWCVWLVAEADVIGVWLWQEDGTIVWSVAQGDVIGVLSEEQWSVYRGRRWYGGVCGW